MATKLRDPIGAPDAAIQPKQSEFIDLTGELTITADQVAVEHFRIMAIPGVREAFAREFTAHNGGHFEGSSFRERLEACFETEARSRRARRAYDLEHAANLRDNSWFAH